MISLKNRNVLITGGSRGIGEACVKLFAQAGAKVAFTFNCAAEKAAQLEKLSNDIVQIKAYRVNLNSLNEIETVVKKVQSDFGSIDILVNNAGIWKEAAVDKMSLEEWEEMIRINLTASFLFCRYTVPMMEKNKFGRIINISSTAGQRGEAFHSHYAASKGGIISFTKSLAAELGERNITVNSVAPGWVITDMTKASLEDKKILEREVNEIPLKKIASAEEIAGPVLFLASDLASHINGEILNVNGGAVLCG